MLVATTHQIEGKHVVKYLGIVTGEAIVGVNFVRDFFGRMRDFFGGRVRSFEYVLAEARKSAEKEMSQNAEKLGANAVIGVDLDYEVLGQKNGMLMIALSGTAVVVA